MPYLEFSWYKCRTIESGSHVEGSFSLHSHQSTGQMQVCTNSTLFLTNFGIWQMPVTSNAFLSMMSQSFFFKKNKKVGWWTNLAAPPTASALALYSSPARVALAPLSVLEAGGCERVTLNSISLVEASRFSAPRDSATISDTLVWKNVFVYINWLHSHLLVTQYLAQNRSKSLFRQILLSWLCQTLPN